MYDLQTWAPVSQAQATLREGPAAPGNERTEADEETVVYHQDVIWRCD